MRRLRTPDSGLWAEHPRRTLVAIPLAIGLLCGVAAAQVPWNAPRAATRIISLVPSITEMLYEIGAGSQVLAVSSFDHFPPEVEKLPRVGALLDPDTERILSLKPDLVALYGSQTDLQLALHRAGIRTYAYRHGGVEATLQTMRELGPITGTDAGAAAAAVRVRARLEAVKRRVAGRSRPRTLLVFGREPGTLRSVYAAGGVGFMHDLLTIAGAANVFADVTRESAQPSQEQLLVRKPDVVLEVQGTQTLPDARGAMKAWSVLGSVPAVRNGRIQAIAGSHLVVPGPRLGEAAEAIARAIHPDAF
jgi:iron complex transport system substrate-binding protein